MSEPLIAELEAYHEDCFSIDATSRIPDSSIKFLCFGGFSKWGTSVIHELKAPDVSTLIRALGSHPRVRKLSVIRKDKATAEVDIITAPDSLFITGIGETGCIPIEPTGTADGIDRYSLIVPDGRKLQQLFEILSEKYHLKLKAKRYIRSGQASFASFRSSGFLQLKTASELLTPRQFEAFDLACKEGYYSKPKRIKLEELSRKMEIHKATYAELLSKSEAKLLPIMNEILRMMR